MLIENILFYIFSILSVTFSLLVIGSRNPIHSILSLVLVFFNAAGLLILLGVEFLAMLFLIVYVGAVAVLFLFVIMMLNIKIVGVKSSIYRYLPFAIIVISLLCLGLIPIIETDFGFLGLKSLFSSHYFQDFYLNPINIWATNVIPYNNTMLLGNVLYTHYSLLFITSGVILLVSMLGAISLTLHRRNDVKRQLIYKQIQRGFNNTIIWKN